MSLFASRRPHDKDFEYARVSLSLDGYSDGPDAVQQARCAEVRFDDLDEGNNIAMGWLRRTAATASNLLSSASLLFQGRKRKLLGHDLPAEFFDAEEPASPRASKRPRRSSFGPPTPAPLSPLGTSFTPRRRSRHRSLGNEALSATTHSRWFAPWSMSNRPASSQHLQLLPDITVQQGVATHQQISNSADFWRVQLEAIYRRRNPYKLGKIAGLMEKYKGSEAILYKKVCLTYDLDPTKFYSSEAAWEAEEEKYNEDNETDDDDQETPSILRRVSLAGQSIWGSGRRSVGGKLFGGALLPSFSRASLGGALVDAWTNRRTSTSVTDYQPASEVQPLVADHPSNLKTAPFAFESKAINKSPLVRALGNPASQRPVASSSSSASPFQELQQKSAEKDQWKPVFPSNITRRAVEYKELLAVERTSSQRFDTPQRQLTTPIEATPETPPMIRGKPLVGAKRILPLPSETTAYSVKRQRLDSAEISRSKQLVPQAATTPSSDSSGCQEQRLTSQRSVDEKTGTETDRPKPLVGRLSAERRVWPPPRPLQHDE